MQLIHCNFEDHAQAIVDIFNYEIVNTTALYEYHPRSLETMKAWFETKVKNNFPVIAAVDENGVLMGFASYGTFRAWAAYKYSVEHSVYIEKNFRGQGLAKMLMEELISLAKQQGIHVIIGAIDAANSGSISLHKKLGFNYSGTIKQAGFKFGKWLDFDFYQLILETPSEPVDG